MGEGICVGTFGSCMVKEFVLGRSVFVWVEEFLLGRSVVLLVKEFVLGRSLVVWVKEFVLGRSQRVRVDGKLSEEFRVT